MLLRCLVRWLRRLLWRCRVLSEHLPVSEKLVEQIKEIVMQGIAKLNEDMYGSYNIPDVLIKDRANNITMALMPLLSTE